MEKKNFPKTLYMRLIQISLSCIFCRFTIFLYLPWWKPFSIFDAISNVLNTFLINKKWLPRTVTLVTSILGGCVFTWQTYKPRSSLRTPAIASLQLFGYWKLTLYLGSEMWVVLPRVKRDAQSALRRNHMTYNCDTDSTIARWSCVRISAIVVHYGSLIIVSGYIVVY